MARHKKHARSRQTPRRAAPTAPAAAAASPAARRRLATLVLGGLAVLAAAGAGVWWWVRGPAFTIEQRADQNVLLVTIDTLRADALSCYGGRAQTPNLDALAAHGARFSFAHSQAVVTLVSHASILTGHYPYETGVRDNTGYRLPPGRATAATRLKALGFATGAFIGGFPLDRRFGLSPGFDEYNDLIGEITTSVDFLMPDRRADQVISPALTWINQQSGKWFAWVHLYDPHAPYKPPPEWLAKYPDDPYLGEVAYADFALGALFERLRTEPRPTLVIVTADHGESLGEHGELTHSLFAYESTLHIPLIMGELGPTGRRPTRGVVIDSPVRHVDLVPTILDAIGAPADASLPGSSLRPVVASGSGGDRPSYFEAMTANVTRGWAPLRGVLVGHDKFIDLPIAELYNLATDPHEQQNTEAEHPQQAQVMLNTLRSFSVAPPGRPQEETTAVLDRLRALGYIGSGGVPPRERYTEADDPKRLITLDAAMHRGVDDYQRGRFDEAIKEFQGVIEKRPDTEDAYRYLAFIYWSSGRPQQAIATLELALKRGITQAEVRIALGEYLSETNQGTRAVQLLEGVAGDDPDALTALGIAYSKAGRPKEAMKTFERLVTIDPTSGLGYENIATLQLQAGDYKASEATLRKALAIDPKLPGAYTALGVVLSHSGRRDEAIEAWKHAVSLDHTEYDALYNLTIELFATHQTEQARAYGQQYVDTAPPALYASDISEIRGLLGSGKV
jgi:arylsulfatase A-like enzyme/tetratricopeptide (TPR) repeat protein